MRRTPDPTRRRLLAGALAVATALVLAGCGSEGSDSSAAQDGTTASAGPWSYTDDLGQKVELDRTPVRIAAYGDAAAALWHFGVTPVAIFTWMDPAEDDMFDGLDLSETEVVGSTYGEISIEELAAAKPDIIVATSYTGDTADEMYGFKDKAQLKKIKAIAPVVAVAQVGSMKDVIETNERLAASLGVDTGDGSRVAKDRAAFEAASAELTTAAKSGLSVVPMYADGDGLYLAKAPDDPALKYYQDIGVSFTEIGGKDYYWEILSWENADRYEGDILLNATRNSYSTKQLGEQPTFARLKAYQAGQVHPWLSTSMDYPSQTKYMKELAGWLSTDRDVVS
ncbi:ABC transporter substrate-binding protein [Nocardioides sp. URHA0020]|uniref:ABC transporter substrate-binding protein n=1 Tax=Nocardioides sp. URHA0020 TaxID=1380392 RepID=UPI0005611C34|nr:ABC transporter substrate-binding protein [Nocardioides sp. URHA0020]